MATFSPNNVELKEKMRLEKSLKEQLEREREARLQEEIDENIRKKNIKMGAKRLKTCGILEAYDYFLEQSVVNCNKFGLPNKEDVFDFAALCILKYERKRRTDKMKEIQERMKKRQNQFQIEDEPPVQETPKKGKKKGGKADERSKSKGRSEATKRGKTKSPAKTTTGKKTTGKQSRR